MPLDRKKKLALPERNKSDPRRIICGLERVRIPRAVVLATITIGLLLSGCSGFGGVEPLYRSSHREEARFLPLQSVADGKAIATSTSTPIHDDGVCDDNTDRHTNGALRVETKFVLLETKHPGNVGSSARSMKTMGFTDGLVLVRPNDGRVLGRKKCKEAASGALDVLENAVVVSDHDLDKNGDDLSETESNATCLVDQALELAFGEPIDCDRNNNGNTENKIPVIVCGTGMPVDMGRKRVTQRYLEPRIFFDEIVGGQGAAAGDAATTTTTTTGEEQENENERVIRIAFLFGNEKYGMTPQDMARCDVMLGIPTNPEFGSLNLATAVQIIAYDWRQALGGFSSRDA